MNYVSFMYELCIYYVPFMYSLCMYNVPFMYSLCMVFEHINILLSTY